MATDQQIPVSGFRQKGGVRLSLTARDDQSVVETAAETASRLISRINLGSAHYNRLTVNQQVWIKGNRGLFLFPIAGGA